MAKNKKKVKGKKRHPQTDPDKNKKKQDGESDYGVLPDRDLRKNLGCGG